MSKTNNNPLNQYFRTISSYVTLPSGTSYYDPSVLTYEEDGEISVRAMTSVDELALKNPDALLNGTAVSKLLLSCVPSLKDPSKLLQTDLEIFIIAIRKASYGEEMDIFSSCPKCQHQNKFSIDLSQIESTKQMLESEYRIELREGLTAFVRPHTYEGNIKANKIAFEQVKLSRDIENQSDDFKLKIFNESFNKIAQLNFDLIADSVYKIEATGIKEPVTNKEHIKEFLQNITVKEEKIIENLLSEINSLGVTKKMDVVCEKCKNEWVTDLAFDPTSFFTKS